MDRDQDQDREMLEEMSDQILRFCLLVVVLIWVARRIWRG